MSVKGWLQGLPTTPLRVVASVFVFVLTAFVVCVRIALGASIPDNAEWYFGMILGVMGVDTAHYFAKRKTEWQPSLGMVDMTTSKELDPEKVAVTEEHPVPDLPRSGVRPRNPEIAGALEHLAARQRASIENPPTEASD